MLFVERKTINKNETESKMENPTYAWETNILLQLI